MEEEVKIGPVDDVSAIWCQAFDCWVVDMTYACWICGDLE